MSALTDVLHRVVNYLPWRNESELNDVREAIDKVEGEIKSFVNQPAGVTNVNDADRVTTEVVTDPNAKPGE